MKHKDNNIHKDNFNITNKIDLNNDNKGSDKINESDASNLNHNNVLNQLDNTIPNNIPDDLELQIIIDRKDIKEEEQKEKTNKEKIKRGRKRKGSLIKGNHNKYSYDNLFRTIKGIILRVLYPFINSKIRRIYKKEPYYDINKFKLMKIRKKQVYESNIVFNKNFLNKTLKNIFSDNITKKIKKYNKDHNKNLIIKLLNDNNEGRRLIFHNLFEKTFLECLEHFRGTKKIEELEGITTFDTYKVKFMNDSDYLATLKHTLNNYEIIINKRKGRKTNYKIE